MTIDHLRILWGAVGATLSMFVLNAWLSSTGAEPIFSGALPDKRRVPGAVFALPIISISLIVLAEIGRRHAKRSNGTVWHNRLPTFALSNLNTASSEGKLYQAFFLVMFVLVPLVSLLHFARIALSGTVVSTSPKQQDLLGALSWPASPGFADGKFWNDGYRIGESLVPGKLGGVTWFPVVEPVVFAVLIIAAMIAVLHFFRALIT